jgi:hypothetical protein
VPNGHSGRTPEDAVDVGEDRAGPLEVEAFTLTAAPDAYTCSAAGSVVPLSLIRVKISRRSTRTVHGGHLEQGPCRFEVGGRQERARGIVAHAIVVDV